MKTWDVIGLLLIGYLVGMEAGRLWERSEREYLRRLNARKAELAADRERWINAS